MSCNPEADLDPRVRRTRALLESILRADLSRLVRERFPERPAFTRANFAAVAAIVIRFPGDLEAACPRTARDAESLIHPALQDEIRGLIDAWLPAEGPNSPVRPGSRDTVVTVMSWSLFGCAYRWSRGKRERRAEDLAQELAGMLLPSGLATGSFPTPTPTPTP